MRRRCHTKRLLVVICALTPAVDLVACGADASADEKEIRQVVADAFTTTGKGRCLKLATQAFLEQSEASKGREAVASCERDADEKTADSVDFTNVDVDGERAAARFDLVGSSSGYREASVQLKKTDETWKLDKLTDLRIDRDRFLQNTRKELTSTPGAVSAAVADCVMKAYRSYGEREMEQAIVKPDVARLGGPVLSCASEAELKKSIPPAVSRCVGRGLDRAQRSGRLTKLLGEAATFDELDAEAFQSELQRLLADCKGTRRAPSGAVRVRA